MTPAPVFGTPADVTLQAGAAGQLLESATRFAVHVQSKALYHVEQHGSIGARQFVVHGGGGVIGIEEQHAEVAEYSEPPSCVPPLANVQIEAEQQIDRGDNRHAAPCEEEDRELH